MAGVVRTILATASQLLSSCHVAVRLESVSAMTDRELSQRLAELAYQLETIADSDMPNWFTEIRIVSDELRELSNQKYTPGHTSWQDVRKVANSSKKKEYRDSKGRITPF